MLESTSPDMGNGVQKFAVLQAQDNISYLVIH